MKQALFNLNKNILNLIKEIGQEAQKSGMVAYGVGGFVRDLMLKKKNLDVDIAIEGNAVSLAQILARKKRAAVITYKQFKTATLKLPNGLRVDLTTARKEKYIHSGALPDVSNGFIGDDLFRRDFTINAMAVLLNPDQFGMLIDPCGGQRDLIGKEIRVLHTKSFIDDPTRILRAVRFEQRLNFSIEKNTLKLMRTAIKKDVAKGVKSPRYFEEFQKILKEQRPLRHIKRLYGLGGFRFIGPRFRLDSSTVRLLSSTQRSIGWFKGKFPENSSVDYWLVFLMAIMYYMNPREVQTRVSQFNLKKGDRKKIFASKKASGILKELSVSKMCASAVYSLLKPLSHETILFLRALGEDAKIRRRIYAFLKEYHGITLNINGEDLKRLGVKPGKQMGALLKELLHAKIDRKIRLRKEEIRLARILLTAE